MCIMRMLQFLLMMVQIKKKKNWFTWVAKRFLEVEEDLNVG